MVIEWKKIEEDPERDVKVVGQFLLDNKNKIEALEKELADSEAHRTELKSNLDDINNKLKTFEKKLIEQTEKFSEIEKKLEKSETEKKDLLGYMEKTEDDLLKARNANEDLQKALDQEKLQFCDLQANNIELKAKFEALEPKFQDISNELKDKTLALEKAEQSLNTLSEQQETFKKTADEKGNELEQLFKTIADKDNELKALSGIIEEKNRLVSQISEEVKQRKEESSDLLGKIKDRDIKIQELSVQAPSVHASIPVAIQSTSTPNPAQPSAQKSNIISTPASSLKSSSSQAACPPGAEWLKTDTPFKIFLIQGEDLKEAEGFTTDQVAIIVDKQNSKIWVWKGRSASRMNTIKASSKAPSIRSSLMLYNWKIDFIDQGQEPAEFPLKGIA